MTLHRESARIYEFPVKARASVRVDSEQARPVAELAALRPLRPSYGEAWYHAAAVEEERAQKR